MRRFRIAEQSMLPILRPGDTIVTVPDTAPAAGSIVVFPHPHRSSLWLVKRVSAADGGEAWVVSDNPVPEAVDSGRLGWVPTAGMERAVLRLRPPLGVTRLRARPG